MIPKWASDITLEDLSGSARDLAGHLGVQAALNLLGQFGGTVLYIPKMDPSLRDARNRHIRKEFNGYNARMLALKFDVSESWIHRIVSGDNLDGQLNLFEEIS